MSRSLAYITVSICQKEIFYEHKWRNVNCLFCASKVIIQLVSLVQQFSYICNCISKHSIVYLICLQPAKASFTLKDNFLTEVKGLGQGNLAGNTNLSCTVWPSFLKTIKHQWKSHWFYLDLFFLSNNTTSILYLHTPAKVQLSKYM